MHGCLFFIYIFIVDSWGSLEQKIVLVGNSHTELIWNCFQFKNFIQILPNNNLSKPLNFINLCIEKFILISYILLFTSFIIIVIIIIVIASCWPTNLQGCRFWTFGPFGWYCLSHWSIKKLSKVLNHMRLWWNLWIIKSSSSIIL